MQDAQEVEEKLLMPEPAGEGSLKATRVVKKMRVRRLSPENGEGEEEGFSSFISTLRDRSPGTPRSKHLACGFCVDADRARETC